MTKFKKRVLSVVLCGLCALLIAMNGIGMLKSVKAKAYYCDDGTYEGEGVHTSTTYTVEYDSYVEHNEYRVKCAPSLDNVGLGTINCCGAIAGSNVVAFYDRYYKNLIPNYEPGISAGGTYRYLPSLGSPVLKTLHSTLYNYMNTNVNYPGATEDDFRSGLSRYVNEKGYQIGFNSIYQNSNSVNLIKVKQMVNSNQVAVLFLSGYNFVFSFSVSENSRTVYQEKSDAGHIMMIYGYFTVDYYKNNQLFLTETYLEASSCTNTADSGFIKMNDYGVIDNALIVAIS